MSDQDATGVVGGDSEAQQRAVEHGDNDHEDDVLLQAAHDCDAEYAGLVRQECRLQQALAQLKTEESCLERAIAACSDQPGPTRNSAATTNKKQGEAQALRRLEEALMMESSSSDDEDENKGADKDADSFTII